MRFVDLTAVKEFRKFHFAGCRRFMAVAGGKVVPGIGLDEIAIHANAAPQEEGGSTATLPPTP